MGIIWGRTGTTSCATPTRRNGGTVEVREQAIKALIEQISQSTHDVFATLEGTIADANVEEIRQRPGRFCAGGYTVFIERTHEANTWRSEVYLVIAGFDLIDDYILWKMKSSLPLKNYTKAGILEYLAGEIKDQQIVERELDS